MRINISKSKNAEQVYIIQSYRSHGKTSSKIYKKLGSMDQLLPLHDNDRQKVLVWAKEQARIATEQYNNEIENVSISFSPTQLLDKNITRSFNCGYLFLQSICSSLRFDNICRNIKRRHSFDFNLNSILSDLIYSRFLYPSSKRCSFDFAHSLLEQPDSHLHDVYRALSILATESDYIQADIYRNSNFLHNRNTNVLYYDCTNFFFEIEQEDGFKKYGKSKENRPNPIVGMGLFMDADGFPLAFDLHPGNQNEQKTLKPLEQKVIRDFECSQFIYCSDSGLASQDNKLFNDIGSRSYVITQSLKKLKKEDREIALNTKQYRKLGSTQFIDLKDLDESDPYVFESIYYKEIPIESKKISETLIVTYSPKYRAYQAKIRQGQIDRAEKMIGNGGKVKKNRRNPNDPARFIKKTATTIHGEVAEEMYCELDQEAIKNETMYDGFYAVTTDIEGDVSEIIKINQRRWQIEECFRIMKSDFDARPIYLQREDRIKAHFLICFLALLIHRILESKLQYQYTTEQIIDTLRNMQVCEIKEHGYIPTYKRTDLTDDLHELFGFRTDTQIIKKAKMRNIIKQTRIK